MTFLNFSQLRKVFSVQNKRKILFWKSSQIFLWLESVFYLLKNIFHWPTFLITNKYKKVWKLIFWKLVSISMKHETNTPFMYLPWNTNHTPQFFLFIFMIQMYLCMYCLYFVFLCIFYHFLHEKGVMSRII